MNKKEFEVDASLLRELGERLIGRPAIALGELVKNSYDADARNCSVTFGADTIEVSDDGTGISESDFLSHWMRIGTTHKVDKGQSREFRRPYTGSKGVGRLAVQFLADEMTIESTTPDNEDTLLYVMMDWRKAVRGQNLNTVEVLWEPRQERATYANKSACGTRIVLKNLKSKWDRDSINTLGRDVWMLRSPFTLFSRKTSDNDAGFEISLDAPGIAGAHEAFDDVMRTLFANWKARIRGTIEDGRSGRKARIVVDFKKGFPEDSKEDFQFKDTVDLPIRVAPKKKDKNGDAAEGAKDDGDNAAPNDEGADAPDSARSLIDTCKFQILIFKPEGRQPDQIPVGEIREYLAEYGNVSVYDAGFRLPYYGSGRDPAGQDWLGIAIDQGRRLNISELLPAHLKSTNKYMQDLPAPGRIFGAVDIDTNHERSVAESLDSRPGEWLQIQPGRDRLLDNEAFNQLRNLVRLSMDFYAHRHRFLALKVAERERPTEPTERKYDRAIETLEKNKDDIPPIVFKDVRKELADARRASIAEGKVQDRRGSLLAPLAAAGMAALALNHELARESTFLSRMSSDLRRLARKHSLPELKAIADEFDEARTRLDSLQELFAPLLSDEDKEASDRLKIRALVQQTARSMQILMPSVDMSNFSKIPAELRFPMGSLAEWNAILQNVLANAWNAMLDAPQTRILFRGGRDANGREWLRVSDTGQGLGVPLKDAATLFEPFERRLTISPDRRSIAIGGQGLGLAIVRMIAVRRSAKVAFVEPEPGYSTTFEISWKG